MIPNPVVLNSNIKSKIFSPVRKQSLLAPQGELYQTVREFEEDVISVGDEYTSESSLDEINVSYNRVKRGTKKRTNFFGSYCKRYMSKKKMLAVPESTRNSSFIMPDIHSLGMYTVKYCKIVKNFASPYENL